ncbi:MAG: chemotaxis protein CheW [Bacteroidales bacterium]|nr:chemotaxis protein CheW [Bacteroidales bacterium]
MENFSGASPYLSFLLNNELYAFDIGNVVEVTEYPKITAVPQCAAYITGVFNFRGEILPAIDVMTKCNLKRNQDAPIDTVAPSVAPSDTSSDTSSDASSDDDGEVIADVYIDDRAIIVLDINRDDPELHLTAGAIVEKVSDVINIKPIDIIPVHDFDTKIDASFVEGIYNYDGKIITILDTSKILALNFKA